MEEEKAKYYEKARGICARQETAKSELKRKLAQKGCDQEWIQEIIDQLEEEGMIDERRYAELFTRSKLEKSAWGPKRIKADLRGKGVDQELVDEAWKEVGKDTHERVLKELLAKKWQEGIDRGKEDAKEKSIAAAERKGHPLSMILDLMEGLSSPDGINGIETGGDVGRNSSGQDPDPDGDPQSQ